MIDGNFITVPLDDAVQDALTAWVASHLPSLEEALAPFELVPADITMPRFERLVYDHEARS
ncbi:hypothetical protein [Microbacterium kyungheense]|uniref:hypothetical protein n=1 Tax=Microbacterium kyungheense TaxID=1263636 RepID=UPI001150319C|nr:hypothetical protein [Microbacterium kyungheense]